MTHKHTCEQHAFLLVMSVLIHTYIITDRQTDTHTHTYIHTDTHTYIQTDTSSMHAREGHAYTHTSAVAAWAGSTSCKGESRERGTYTHECTQTFLQGRTERGLTHMSAHILTSACCSFGESRERGDLNKAYTYIQIKSHCCMAECITTGQLTVTLPRTLPRSSMAALPVCKKAQVQDSHT